jgi:hypothetical protein
MLARRPATKPKLRRQLNEPMVAEASYLQSQKQLLWAGTSKPDEEGAPGSSIDRQQKTIQPPNSMITI